MCVFTLKSPTEHDRRVRRWYDSMMTSMHGIRELTRSMMIMMSMRYAIILRWKEEEIRDNHDTPIVDVEC
jgi:hypothetical protein